jgi:hypothetical protein
MCEMMARLVVVSTLLAAAACVSPPEDRLTFEAQGETFRLQIYSGDWIVVRIGDDERTFSAPTIRYPRWDGVLYDAEAHGRRLRLAVRDDRPCDGAPRSALVELSIGDSHYTGCGRHVDAGSTKRPAFPGKA